MGTAQVVLLINGVQVFEKLLIIHARRAVFGPAFTSSVINDDIKSFVCEFWGGRRFEVDGAASGAAVQKYDRLVTWLSKCPRIQGLAFGGKAG